MSTVLTDRLRLEPVSLDSADDLHLVLTDPAVWPWYAERCPTRSEVRTLASRMADGWRLHGVHKLIAYDRSTREVIGRGGLSRTPVDADWAQVHRFLPQEPCALEPYRTKEPFVAHANWLELGWAVRERFWGHGYAAEIGRAGLAFAFDRLQMRAVVSCTARSNVRSSAVMERIGMSYAGEVRSPGVVPGSPARDETAFATCVLLRGQWGVGSGR
ncbi:GNAT family N-acetyltransferase [Flexivirga oryzae]|uniref:RimJ/RimL family protein N-acetyltransferase n=1 Tax=Flexivirga oryzae TaxID=1794944 RepID=A0A839N0Z5_9MICO|nr:GNAT family N-acetyltransferase [Flexivirga oryzae]MBB2891400.1 RimJ/RimL family protein N-acetyltransferase [Flexivirga oryzae]